VIEIDVENKIAGVFGPNLGATAYKWTSAALAPNGRIYATPHAETRVLELNPENKSIALQGSHGTLSTAQSAVKWTGTILAPNGKIFGIPSSATQFIEVDTLTTPNKPEITLSPYFNKF